MMEVRQIEGAGFVLVRLDQCIALADLAEKSFLRYSVSPIWSLRRSRLGEDLLKRGVFKSVDELVCAIELFVLAHNEAPKPFIRTASARDFLEKVMRAKAKLKTVQTTCPGLMRRPHPRRHPSLLAFQLSDRRYCRDARYRLSLSVSHRGD